MKRIASLILLIFIELTLFAQEEIWMHPNRGQWHENISYKINIPGGNMFLEKTGFTYDFNNQGEVYDHAHEGESQEPFKGHAVKTIFVGANPKPVFEEIELAPFYENYLLGNDSNKWASNVFPCHQVDYLELYNGIDLSIYESNASLKYDILVDAGTDPSIFKVSYEGQDKISISENGELVISTSLGTITEGKPYAYQQKNGLKKEIPCHYVLVGNEMHFEFPEGFDQNLPLVIDPDLSFSTFTGATSDNWGMTACPDINKNLIAGGIVFGTGYPTTSGAYDVSFNNGQVDVALSKFNANGSGLIFSTFLGGNGSETPHSLIVNDANELFVMGATSSTNFPCTSSAYQNTHHGGIALSIDGISFSSGADIFITHLNATGTGVSGSTYYGGSGTDGISNASNDIAFNYGDMLRGEIMVDAQSNVYISSTTQSNNIPINGGFQSSLSGQQDAVVAKFNSNLSNLLWSSYIGGSGLESGNSVQLDANGNIFVAGGTTSSNFPVTSGQYKATYQGGIVDGYVIKFNAPTYNSPKATYLGTNDYDQAYFVQLDIDDNVYIYGQTKGAYPLTSGLYSNPNSGQFIHKLNNTLTASTWSTTFGAGTGNEELSPTAFLVSDCYEIYIAGWGGQINVQYSSAINSTSSGMPVTSDAYQSTTSGSNFYLALFTANMGALKYATYMGSLNGSTDHVDGGTSRFDKGGGVYHAVCAACGGNTNGFPTTPGVYSQNNNSSNCNMAAFLFELSKIEATLSAASPTVCIPDPVVFQNTSQNGNQYFWDFGDGSTSTQFAPTHAYQNPGIYTVMLVVSDASGCYDPDTAYMDVDIQLFQGQAGTLIDTICPGTSVELWAIGGDSYSWGPPGPLNNPNSSNPIATIWEETTFTVDITSVCGQSQVEVTVFVYGANATISPDTAICIGDSIQLFSSGGVTYSWTPPTGLDDPSSPNPWASPSTTTDYYLETITQEGCSLKDTVQVWVDLDLPFPVLADSIAICHGSSQQIIVTGGTYYNWTPDYNISATNVNDPTIWPYVDTMYHVLLTNACGDTPDSIKVHVIVIDGWVSPDTTICREGRATLSASGGVSYTWYPSATLTNSTGSTTHARPSVNTLYSVIITDQNGCKDTLTTNVFLYPRPQIVVSPAVYGVVGDTIQIEANAVGTVTWSPPTDISCVICPDPYVWPSQQIIYTATVTDSNGCKNWGEVPIYFDPLIYVPNAFTPNGDSFNEYFKAQGLNILDFEMLIFNRWGELIYTINNLDQSWDGTYRGVPVQDDVYVWQVRYHDLNGDPYVLRGHVTCLR
ncbi:MAG: gliding motility-associated C-terminal domain-containing protein [Crocinitomicaceae bacterium]